MFTNLGDFFFPFSWFVAYKFVHAFILNLKKQNDHFFNVTATSNNNSTFWHSPISLYKAKTKDKTPNITNYCSLWNELTSLLCLKFAVTHYLRTGNVLRNAVQSLYGHYRVHLHKRR